MNEKTESELLTKSSEILENSNKIIALLNDFKKSNEMKSMEMLSWAKQFHIMLESEYAKGAQGNVFAILFLNKNTEERRLIQVVASDFEKAYALSIRAINGSMDSPPSDWVIETYTKQSVPIDEKLLENINKKVNNIERPLESYINSLELARDRWARGITQKKVINVIIKKIKKYGREKYAISVD
jgi:hypothetical protein